MLSKINRTMILINAMITFLLYIMYNSIRVECDILYSLMINMQKNIIQKAEYDAVVYEGLEFELFEAKNTAESAYDKAQYVIDTMEREIK